MLLFGLGLYSWSENLVNMSHISENNSQYLKQYDNLMFVYVDSDTINQAYVKPI